MATASKTTGLLFSTLQFLPYKHTVDSTVTYICMVFPQEKNNIIIMQPGQIKGPAPEVSYSLRKETPYDFPSLLFSIWPCINMILPNWYFKLPPCMLLWILYYTTSSYHYLRYHTLPLHATIHYMPLLPHTTYATMHGLPLLPRMNYLCCMNYLC
jgi:hypothetical protein